MRVISGICGGRKLKAPKGLKTRPTTDKIKQAIFNKLQLDEIGEVLDLFAGSGGMGIEFLSRGAEKVVFVDGDFNSIKIIKENLSDIGLEENAEVYKNDVFRAVSILGQKRRKFDYIFLDPPYENGFVPKALEMIYEKNLLKDSGMIIAEHEKFLDLTEMELSFEIETVKKYGDTIITFLKNKED